MGIKYYPSINDFIFKDSFLDFPNENDALKNKIYVDKEKDVFYRSDGISWHTISGSVIEYVLLQLQSQNDTVLTDALTYYNIDGTFSDNSLSKGFTIGVDGLITYNGDGGIFKIQGTSNSEVSGACSLIYGFAINDVVVGETPHDFTQTSKSENFSITSLINISSGDTFRIKAQSDSAGITLTVKTLNFIFSRLE